MTNYYYSVLTDNNKKLYNDMLSAIRHSSPSATFCIPADSDDIIQTYSSILYDNPDIFHMNISHIKHALAVKRVDFSYMYTGDELSERKNALNKTVEDIINRFGDCSKKSQQMICLQIHNYLIRTVTYDNEAVKNSYDSAPDSYTAYGALVNKKAVCHGISLAFKLLCDKYGVPCFIATGNVNKKDGSTEPHSWNIVYIDGRYAHIDVTWDLSVSLSSGRNRFDYFLINDEEITVDRSFSRNYPVSKNTSGLGYFHSTGRYFTNMKDLRDYIKAQADSKPDFICFKLEKSKFLTDDVLKGILDKVDEAVAGVLCTGGQYYTIHNKRQLVFFYGIEYSHRFT